MLRKPGLLLLIILLLFIFKLQNVTGEMCLECYFSDAPGPGVGGMMMWDVEQSQPDILLILGVLPGQGWAEQAVLNSKTLQAEVRSLVEAALNVQTLGT